MDFEDLASDLVIGTKALSECTPFTPRQLYHMAEKGELGLFKLNGKICGRKSTLKKRIEKLEARHV